MLPARLRACIDNRLLLPNPQLSNRTASQVGPNLRQNLVCRTITCHTFRLPTRTPCCPVEALQLSPGVIAILSNAPHYSFPLKSYQCHPAALATVSRPDFLLRASPRSCFERLLDLSGALHRPPATLCHGRNSWQRDAEIQHRYTR
jgi:hypothetical protein